MLGYVGLVLFTTFWTLGGPSIVDVLLDLAIPYLPIIAVLLVATVGSGASLAWAVLGHLSLSLPRNERLQSTVQRMERSNSMLDTLGLSEYVAPTERSDEEKMDALKQRYVEGEIDEDEFEREIERLNASDSTRDTRKSNIRRSKETDREW